MSIKFSLYVRRAEREDLDTVVDWMEDPDFIRFLYGDPARSPKRMRENIVNMLGRSPGNTMPLGVYLIMDSAEYGPFGMLALTNISWRNRSVNIDTYIGKKELREGFIGAVAFFRALEYCFYELNMHRVNLLVYSFNTRSWRVIERSGAVRELVLKDHVIRDGKFYDMYGYGLLRHEFDKLHSEISTRMPGITLEANEATYEAALARKDAGA